MSHLKKSAATGHLLKNAAGHLVKTCDQSCPVSYDVTMTGLNNLIAVCLMTVTDASRADPVDCADCGSYSQVASFRVPAPPSGHILVDGTDQVYLRRSVDGDCIYTVLNKPVAVDVLGDHYYSTTDCTPPSLLPINEELLTIHLCVDFATSKVQQLNIYVGVGGTRGPGGIYVFYGILFFASGAVDAALGASIPNSLYGGVGSVSVALP